MQLGDCALENVNSAKQVDKLCNERLLAKQLEQIERFWTHRVYEDAKKTLDEARRINSLSIKHATTSDRLARYSIKIAISTLFVSIVSAIVAIVDAIR